MIAGFIDYETAILANSRFRTGLTHGETETYDEKSVASRWSLVVRGTTVDRARATATLFLPAERSVVSASRTTNAQRPTTDFMRLAYLDCFSGISGDMFLGALVDAGVPVRILEETVATLGLDAKIEISRVARGGLAATKVDVYANGEKDLPREVFWEQQSRSSSTHDSAHADEHFSHARGLAEIRKIISDAEISSAAKATAIRVFETLGAAEAEIHNCPIEDIHFHEVGAVDALVDIVCAAVGAEVLAVDQWICSPVNVGGGTVKCAHGTLPVPAPATLKLLKDAPIYSSGPQVELVTPTGAAIVRTLATRFASFPAMKITASGYGAGSRDFSDHPNVLRITLGEAIQQPATAPNPESLLPAISRGPTKISPPIPLRFSKPTLTISARRSSPTLWTACSPKARSTSSAHQSR